MTLYVVHHPLTSPPFFFSVPYVEQTSSTPTGQCDVAVDFKSNDSFPFFLLGYDVAWGPLGGRRLLPWHCSIPNEHWVTGIWSAVVAMPIISPVAFKGAACATSAASPTMRVTHNIFIRICSFMACSCGQDVTGWEKSHHRCALKSFMQRSLSVPPD